MQRVVVTGMGVITPCGIDLPSTWASLTAGKSGAARIALFDPSRHSVQIACEVKGFDPSSILDRKRIKETDRFSQFALAAARMAIDDSGWALTDEERETTGVIVGVGLGGLQTLENARDTLVNKGPTKLSPYTVPAMIANMAAGQISMDHALRGPSFSTTSACTSGAHAIGEAFEWIRRGRASVMVAGGAEATISEVGIAAFQAMYALSRRNEEPTRASRPFDRDRDGFVCGEGAGVLVLESLSRALRRGAHIHGELVGYGATSDAHHLTQPAPEGEGAQRAMRAALADARLSPADVDYINAHGTSTPAGDKNECIAVRNVFGEHAASRKLVISSTKSMTGHLLGAAGAVESVFSLMTIRHGLIPPTINVDNQDPTCDLDVVPHTAREQKVRVVLSNSFGFGGTNATLAFTAFGR